MEDEKGGQGGFGTEPTKVLSVLLDANMRSHSVFVRTKSFSFTPPHLFEHLEGVEDERESSGKTANLHAKFILIWTPKLSLWIPSCVSRSLELIHFSWEEERKLMNKVAEVPRLIFNITQVNKHLKTSKHSEKASPGKFS